jgi:hypothetical protein
MIDCGANLPLSSPDRADDEHDALRTKKKFLTLGTLMNGWLRLLTFGIPAFFLSAPSSGQSVDMAVVRALTERPVDEILDGTPVQLIEIKKYWEAVQGRKRPLIVFFYSNRHGPSQRVATLIRYVSIDYADRLDFRRVKVVEKGNPPRALARDLSKRYSLDATPGILFYDNVGDKMVLEEEDYVEADFKEFRTPSLTLWQTYRKRVREAIDALLAD